jgi:O-antigen ligase
MCSADLINGAKGLKERTLYKIAITLFVGFIYLIVARLALGLVFVYVLVIVLRRIKIYNKKLTPIIGVFIGVVLLLAVNNKNLKKRFHIQNTYTNTIKVISNQEPRVVIWSCFLKLIKSPHFNYLTGYNDQKRIQSDLNNCYKSSIQNVSKKEYYLKTKFNTHNQFFDFFLQGGIIGITLFLLILGYSFYLCRFNFTSLFVLVGFVLFLIAENLFHRQIGVYLVGVFIPLFLNTHTAKKLKK